MIFCVEKYKILVAGQVQRPLDPNPLENDPVWENPINV